MAKAVKAILKLQIIAADAKPAPPLGPALGQYGVAIMEFCKAYNAATKERAGEVVPVEITIYEDKSFTFVLKSPPASVLIKKALKLDKGSGVPNKTKVGKLTRDQLRDIAKQKMTDLNTKDVEQAMKVIAGTARNMGVTVEE